MRSLVGKRMETRWVFDPTAARVRTGLAATSGIPAPAVCTRGGANLPLPARPTPESSP